MGITPENNQIVASKRDLHVARRLQAAAAALDASMGKPVKKEVCAFLADWVANLLACPKLAGREFPGDAHDRTDVQNVEICEVPCREAENDSTAARVDQRFEERAERIQQ